MLSFGRMQIESSRFRFAKLTASRKWRMLVASRSHGRVDGRRADDKSNLFVCMKWSVLNEGTLQMTAKEENGLSCVGTWRIRDVECITVATWSRGRIAI
jgi:hypothetical protein